MRVDVDVAGADQLAASGLEFRARVHAATFTRPSRVELLQRSATLSRSEAPQRTGELVRSITVAADGQTLEVTAQHGAPIHGGYRSGRNRRVAPNPYVERGMAKAQQYVEPVLEAELAAVIEAAF